MQYTYTHCDVIQPEIALYMVCFVVVLLQPGVQESRWQEHFTRLH